MVPQVAEALTRLSREMAANPGGVFDPVGKFGWDAFVKFANLHVLDPKRVPRYSGYVHVSAATYSPGWDCDRVLWFQANTYPVGATAYEGIMRTWMMGTALQVFVYQWIGYALERYFPHVEWIDIGFEKAAFTPGTEEAKFLRGSADIWLKYKPEGDSIKTAVVDLKSTSEGQQAKRSSKKAISPAEPEYIRQLCTYSGGLGADIGILLFWVKVSPHPFIQVDVSPKPLLLPTILHRVKQVFESPTPVVPRISRYCTKCPYQEQCRRIQEGEPC